MDPRFRGDDGSGIAKKAQRPLLIAVHARTRMQQYSGRADWSIIRRVKQAVTIPVLHMIALTRDALKERGVKCAGLLATDGTVQTGIYQRTFAGSGVDLLTPDDPADQAAVIHASKVVYKLYADMFRGLPRDGENSHAPV